MEATRRSAWLLIALSLAGVSTIRSANSAERRVSALPRAHAHNDYEHPRPLLDALDQGFCSIEADIHLVGRRLLVAHDRDKVQVGHTLEALYLDPLLERARRHKGRIYRGGPPVILLVDIKSDAEQTYAALRETLRGYREMLSEFTTNSTKPRAVTVIISGNRPTATIANESPRLVAVDGRLPDLGTGKSKHLLPLISSHWREISKWCGDGPMPEADLKKLRDCVAHAHREDHIIRFWALPAEPKVWQTVYDEGVDLINADDLVKLRIFLLRQN
jgi:hypothetical protein